MDRRNFLQVSAIGTVIGLAGCMSEGESGQSPTDEETETASDPGSNEGEDEIEAEDETEEEFETDVNPSDFETPEEVVRAYIEAQDKADIGTMNILIHPDESHVRPDEEDIEESEEEMEKYSYRVKEMKETHIEDDDRVVRDVIITIDYLGDDEEEAEQYPRTDTRTYATVKDDDGNWRIWLSN